MKSFCGVLLSVVIILNTLLLFVSCNHMVLLDDFEDLAKRNAMQSECISNLQNSIKENLGPEPSGYDVCNITPNLEQCACSSLGDN